MDFSAINPATLVAAMIVASMPVLFAALGELVVEKSGVLNLGVEGMMIIGAVCGFIVAVETDSAILGVLAAMLAGAGLASIFGILTQFFHSNQVATGLALTMFGLGASSLLGQSYAGVVPPDFPAPPFGSLADIPIVGTIVLSHDYLVYGGLMLLGGIWWFLKHSNAGLILTAVGENHGAAHALGFKVVQVRMAAILFGGACGGLGGAYLSLIRVPQWTEGITAGIGWVALALVVFASWRPARVLLGACLFGGVTLLQLNLQAIGIDVNAAYLSMTPYVATIIALVLISGTSTRSAVNAPGSLGQPFHPST